MTRSPARIVCSARWPNGTVVPVRRHLDPDRGGALGPRIVRAIDGLLLIKAESQHSVRPLPRQGGLRLLGADVPLPRAPGQPPGVAALVAALADAAALRAQRVGLVETDKRPGLGVVAVDALALQGQLP